MNMGLCVCIALPSSAPKPSNAPKPQAPLCIYTQIHAPPITLPLLRLLETAGGAASGQEHIPLCWSAQGGRATAPCGAALCGRRGGI
jgi:hypothetical protein